MEGKLNLLTWKFMSFNMKNWGRVKTSSNPFYEWVLVAIMQGF